MRPAVALAILLSALPSRGSAQQELVRGFHGYAWGTQASAIPEVAGTEIVSKRDGLLIRSAQLSFMGKEALAGFYFHPETGGLVEGSYIFPLTLEECEAEWQRIVAAIAAAHPALAREDGVPTRSGSDRQIYESDCEYYVYNGHREEWTATFANPDPPGDRVLLWLRDIGRTVRMTVVYRGGEAQAWVEAAKARRAATQQPSRPSNAIPSIVR